jgi:glycosyltransferase involved in cell wall biosynthesis
VLVRAAAALVERGFNDFEVSIAGEGSEREFLEKLILELKVQNYVKLLGVRHDVGALLEASDLFVMPSRYEGLSIAMIEAMASGLPVIASDAPGLRDYVSQKKNGLLFKVENHEALADSILLLASNKILAKSLAEGARQTFEREYDIRENIKPIDELFRYFSKKERKQKADSYARS